MTIDPAVWSRFAIYLDVLPLFGLNAFALYGLTPRDRLAPMGRTVRWWLAALALAGLPLTAWAFLALVAAMAGTSIGMVDRDLIGQIASGTAVGIAFQVRIAALLVCALAAFLPARRVTFVVGTLAAGVAVATLAWTGHGAMDDGAAGWVHLAADIAHLVAAGTWAGALLGFLLLVLRGWHGEAPRQQAAYALHRFARIGTATVAVLVASGAASGWFLLIRSGGGLLPLDTYRVLLLAKLTAFVAMLMLAALNRFRLTPRLATGAGTPAAIRISLLAETSLAIVILLFVAWLGLISPSR